jgi:hypothetical protein
MTPWARLVGRPRTFKDGYEHPAIYPIYALPGDQIKYTDGQKKIDVQKTADVKMTFQTENDLRVWLGID